ncbi:WD repeat-containing protein [Reticulomyxa filosa]|uniref:WD repeat-containing protein n=1 Tax=Reticulomyxa filosa TaxID=46433 RepID=X6LVA6_RETFI|nr:WD repeat-containing protein [Reticulomyxa filosa]|eukprot:ETO05853.1 WD repeat-containing protein [Reticulomyxa filosa]
MSDQIFQSLNKLPTPLYRAQCVLYKHELLICGGAYKRACYSYHTIKNEYKFICEYPADVTLDGHCVVKLTNNNNGITLLSFGGHYKHTLMMKYVSIWNNKNNYNKWIPFTDNQNNPIIIGRDKDRYEGVRAVIGGSNNNLLFITYFKNNISIFDLNTFQFIKHSTLQTDNCINYHCFVSKSENEQEIMKMNEEKKKKNNNEMLLFCKKTGLSIEYNEDKNIFQFFKLPVLCINGIILFFGGWNGSLGDKYVVSKTIYKYLIQEYTWIKYTLTLPIPLHNCFGILNEDNTYIHVIGGNQSENTTVSMHMKTKLNLWRDSSQLSINEIQFIVKYWTRILKIRLGWIDNFNKTITKYVKEYPFTKKKIIIRGLRLLMVLQTHNDAVRNITFSADGRNMVSASYDNTIRILDVSSGKQLQNFIGHDNRIFVARFSPDEHTIISCSKDDTIRLWNINTGTEIIEFKKYLNNVWDVNFSPDGKYIVAGLGDGTIRLYDVNSEIEIKQLLGHSKGVLSIQFSSDGKMIVSSSVDNTINLWNVKSGKILKKFEGHSNYVMRAKFSPDDKFIVSCSCDNTIRIWNIETGIEWKILKGHLGIVYDVKYFPDSQTIISCSGDSTIRLWNVELGKEIQKFEAYSRCMMCVDISQNGNTIAVGSRDGKIRIWSI